MEYHKIINLLDNITTQPSKFRTKKWDEINDDSRGMNNTNSQIRFNTSILKSILCDYSDPYIPVKGTITVTTNAEVIIKYCAPFTDCISEINNTQKGNAKDINIIMPIYNLIEYNDNYSKILGSLWQ